MKVENYYVKYNDPEIWASVAIPELSHYSISNHGRLLNTLTGKYLKGTYNEDGYHRAELRTLDGKRKPHYLHRLVAGVFVSKRGPLCIEVNHKDGNRANNHWSNLEYLTHLENMWYIWNDWLALYEYCPF